MSHMVIYRTADGQPGYHQTDALDDAVSFVERLRNSDGVDHARIFHMEEVTFDFKPYFRVEVGGDRGAPSVPPSLASSPAPAAEPSPLAAPSFSSPAPAPLAGAPVEERPWMDLPLMDEPAPEPAPPAEAPLLMSEPNVAEVHSFPEVPSFSEPEPVAPVFDTVPPPPPPPPAMESDESVATGNGMGARRGLFGR